MKMKSVQKVIAVILMFALCFTLGCTAFAANVCTTIRGNSGKTTVFMVQTESSGSCELKFAQKKGTLAYNNLVSNPKSMSAYDSFQITYQKIDSKACYLPQTVTMTGASLSLKLEKNARYRITVTPAKSDALQRRYGLAILRYITGWKSDATWSISITKGIDHGYSMN